MAFNYRWVVVSLCTCLASIDSTRGQSGTSDDSQDDQSINLLSSEANDAGYSYLRLSDLIREEIQTYLSRMENDLNAMNIGGTYAYPGINPIAIQPRRLNRRGTGDTYESNRPRGCGRRAARRQAKQNQNNGAPGVNEYNVNGQNPSYGYLPSGNQYQYINGGYDGSPNGMMWNSGGYPGQELFGQYFGPGSRMGMRPPPPPQDSYNLMNMGGFGNNGGRLGMRPPFQDSFNLIGNGGPTEISDSNSGPGSYVIQVPNRRTGRRNGPNQISSQSMNSEVPIDGLSSDVELPTRLDGKGNIGAAQMVDSNGNPGSYIVQIPNRRTGGINGPNKGSSQSTNLEIPNDGLSTDVGLPARINGKGNSQNQIMRVPNTITSSLGNMETPITEIQSNNNGIPSRKNGGQSSTQYFAVPDDDGSALEMPVNMPSIGGNSNRIELPGGQGGARTEQSRKNPSMQYFTVSDDGSALEMPNIGGSSNRIELPGGQGGARTGQSRIITIPSSDNSAESSMTLPAGENGRRTGQSRIIMMPSDSFSLDNIAGSVTDSQNGGSGMKKGQSQVTSLPAGSNGISTIEQAATGGGMRNGQSRYILLPDTYDLDDTDGSVIQLPAGGNGASRIITLPSSQRVNQGNNGGSSGTMSLPMDISTSRGPTSTMRTGQTNGDTIRTQPTSESESNYPIDIRNLGQESYSSSPNSEVATSTQTIVSDQPSLDKASSFKLPPSLSKLASSGDLYSDAANQNEGGNDKAKASSRGLGGLFSSFRLGRSPKQSSEGNGISSSSMMEAKPNMGEQIDTRSMETPAEMKIKSGSPVESVKMAEDLPESMTTTSTNAINSRRNGVRPGSFYIIHHPGDSDEFPDIDNYQELLSGLKSPGGKYMTQDMDNGFQMGNDVIQNLDLGSKMSRSQGPVMTSTNSDQSNIEGNGRAGGPRSYKVMVVNGDHDILRNLKLPRPGSQFVVDNNASEEK